MDTQLLIGLGLGLLAGIVAGLKIIAPLTKTTVDDKALQIAEKVKELAASLAK